MYHAPIIKRTFQIIHLLLKQQGHVGVTEISKLLEINKSTTFGILKALEEEGLVIKDGATKKYGLGTRLFELSQMIFKRMDLSSIARPLLEKLGEMVDETVFLGVRDDDRVKIVDVIEAKKDLKISSPIGTRMPLTAGAVGKAFLAQMADEEALRLIDQKGLRRFTSSTITDHEVFLEELGKARKLGYAVDLEEYLKGIRAVAACIVSGGQPLGAVWVAGFTNSMTDERFPTIIRQLTLTAQWIGARIESGVIPLYLHNFEEMGAAAKR